MEWNPNEWPPRILPAREPVDLMRKPSPIPLPLEMAQQIAQAVAPYPKPSGLIYEYGTAGVSALPFEHASQANLFFKFRMKA